MTIRLAINGFGRIGRNVLRGLYTSDYRDKMQVVAVNDLGQVANNAHLFKYDTVHGRFDGDVEHDDENMIVNGDKIAFTSEPDPARLPWQDKDIDIVLECTGRFKSRDKAEIYLKAGPRKVLISAPGKNADATIVFGVNDDILQASHQIVSCASCTTNCLAPIVHVLHRDIGIENGLMTTIHAYTLDQRLTDSYHSDPFRARSATHSMIPTKTGAAEMMGVIIPELAGKLTGLAVRVPLINVSVVDLTVQLKREATVDEINGLFRKASDDNPRVLGYNDIPLVSIDFNHDPRSSIFDANHTKVTGQLAKVMAWYDNEWGFSMRMLDTCLAMMNAK